MLASTSVQPRCLAAAPARGAALAPFCVAPVQCQGQRRVAVQAAAGPSSSGAAAPSRRDVLQAVAATAVLLGAPAGPASAAGKAPKGFVPVQDLQDNYQFLYPFGWQEVSVKGADVVFKDVVEPLESVSVTLTSTDKKDILEFGDIQTVADTLARDVLTSPGIEVKLLSAEQRELKGHSYYEIEFTASNPKYTRHQLAVVACANGTFYTLTTGANERRWGKMKDKLQTTVRSFSLIN